MDPWVIVIVVSALVSVFGGIGYAVWYDYKQKRLVNRKISDQMVIEMARDNGGKVDVAMLCEQAGLTAHEAKVKLKYLAENGVLATDWKKMMFGGGSYVLPNTQAKGFNDMFSKLLTGKGNLAKRLESLFSGESEPNTPLALNQSKDAQIISLALENQGIVSASMVCVKLNISIDEAQRKLEDLRQKQIFISEVGQNGGLMYRLLDI
jgi:predicted transcriptional regulator